MSIEEKEALLTQTMMEAPLGNNREAIYRRRHAALDSAGNFVRLVAEGGMGAIILVDEHPIGKRKAVVLKMLKEEALHGSTRDEATERFRRELETHYRFSERFQAPRIVPCLGLDASATPEKIYGVFPYYPEGSLADFMARGGKLSEGLRILGDAIEGLQTMHGRQTVHRDFCARNIFVALEAGVRKGILGDLGIAIPLGGNTVFSAQQVARDSSSPAGHLGYIDPNYWAAIQGDFYSIGATLYWLITRKNPPAKPDPRGIFLPQPEDHSGNVNGTFLSNAGDLLMSLTCPESNMRLQSARAVREEILHLVDLLRDGQSPDSPTSHSAPPPLPDQSPSFIHRQRKLLWGLLGGIAIVSGVFFGPKIVARIDPGSAPAEKSQPSDQQSPETTENAPVSGVENEKQLNLVKDTPLPQATPRMPEPTPNIIPTRIPVPAGRLKAANALLDSGATDEAGDYLEDLLKQYPADPELSGLLAALLSRQGSDGLQRAKEILRSSLLEHPEQGQLRLALGRMYTQDGKIEDALKIMARTPENSTHFREIRAFAVTLGAASRQED